MQVHQVVDAKGKTVLSGHGTKSGLYPTLKGLKSALKTSWFSWRRNQENEDLEVVTYELVEIKRQKLNDIMQESSKG